uniref:Uncharacterized protein n=1 Tax=Ananas comosus var. bracteatus TaxID=296719 RepID=A0A6V7QR86_ANACO
MAVIVEEVREEEKLRLVSPAFEEGGRLPRHYTGRGRGEAGRVAAAGVVRGAGGDEVAGAGGGGHRRAAGEVDADRAVDALGAGQHTPDVRRIPRASPARRRTSAASTPASRRATTTGRSPATAAPFPPTTATASASASSPSTTRCTSATRLRRRSFWMQFRDMFWKKLNWWPYTDHDEELLAAALSTTCFLNFPSFVNSLALV